MRKLLNHVDANSCPLFFHRSPTISKWQKAIPQLIVKETARDQLLVQDLNAQLERLLGPAEVNAAATQILLSIFPAISNTKYFKAKFSVELANTACGEKSWVPFWIPSVHQEGWAAELAPVVKRKKASFGYEINWRVVTPIWAPSFTKPSLQFQWARAGKRGNEVTRIELLPLNHMHDTRTVCNITTKVHKRKLSTAK